MREVMCEVGVYRGFVGMGVWFYQRRDDGIYHLEMSGTGLAQAWEWKKVEHDGAEVCPTISFDKDMVEVMLDAFAKSGMTSSLAPNTKAEISATRDHLNDMRALVAATELGKHLAIQGRE